MIEKDFLRLRELLSVPLNIALIPHKNPDGDAIGSCLAWWHYLSQAGHNPTVVSPNDFPRFLKWMPGSDEVIIADRDNRRARECIEASKVIIVLDFNSLGRAGQLHEVLANSSDQRTVIMIDHHEQPDDFAHITYSDIALSSTCEMTYGVLRRLSGDFDLSPEIATCLYAGMVTDTGSFKYRCTTSKTHEAAAYLIGCGIDNTGIHQKIFDTYSKGRLQLLGKALGHMRFMYEYSTAYTYLSQEDLDSCEYQKGDTEGFVNYGLSLKGMRFAVIFIENKEEGIIKISFRSTGDFSVNEFARNHFDGGGHLNAAGGRSRLSLQETIARFEALLPQYCQELSTV